METIRLLTALMILLPGLSVAADQKDGAHPHRAALFQKVAKDLRAASDSVDARDEEVDVIVQYDDRAGDLPEAVQQRAGQLRGHYSDVGLANLRVRRSELEELARDPRVKHISPDRKVAATSFPPWMYMEAVGYRFAAMSVPEKPEVTGQGIGVAVIDSGVDKDMYLGTSASGCTESRVIKRRNFVPTERTSNDLYGHGTHVAGIIGGNGSCFGEGADPFNGVAPDVNIISLRALDSRGQGMDSWVISAINWSIRKRKRFNIKVINLSLGRSIQESYLDDPLSQAVERAWKAGIVVVVAAGNAGRDDTMDTDGYGTISSPGNNPYVITVGATRMVGHTGRSDDAVSSYSSKGPTLLDHIVKPDLVAPGNVLYARMSPDDYLVQSYQANKVGVTLRGNYISNVFLLSGTSMAAPVVSGAAALMLEKDASLTPDQVKARLMKAAWKNFIPTASVTDSTTGETFNLQHDLFTVGAGYVDIKAALASTANAGNDSALSPRVVFTGGEAVLETDHPALDGESILWGRDSIWDTSIIWGRSVLWGRTVLSGDSIAWGIESSTGFSIIWGRTILWGRTDPFDEALSIRGDR